MCHFLLTNTPNMLLYTCISAGNMKECAQCLLQSISILERIYSVDSVELGHEYFKLSEVFVNCGNRKQALKYAVKAKTIFKKHFSTQHSQLQEIQSLIKQLEAIT